MTIEPTTWNPADKNANITLSNGDLTATVSVSAWCSLRAKIGKSSGKWYWEVTIDVNTWYHTIGVGTLSASLNLDPGGDVNGYGYFGTTGRKKHNGSVTDYGANYAPGDIIGVALDLDNGKIWFSKNGVWQASGDPAAGTNEAFSGISGTFFPMHGLYTNLSACTVNFGASAFTYSVPSGFTFGFGTTVETVFCDLNVNLVILRSKHWLKTEIQTAGIKTILHLKTFIDSQYPTREKFLLLRPDHIPARNEQNVQTGKTMQFRLYNPDPAFGIDLTTFKLRFDEGTWYRYGDSRLTFTEVTYREYKVYFNPPDFTYDSQIMIEIYCEDHRNNPGIKLEIL